MKNVMKILMSILFIIGSLATYGQYSDVFYMPNSSYEFNSKVAQGKLSVNMATGEVYVLAAPSVDSSTLSIISAYRVGDNLDTLTAGVFVPDSIVGYQKSGVPLFTVLTLTDEDTISNLDRVVFVNFSGDDTVHLPPAAECFYTEKTLKYTLKDISGNASNDSIIVMPAAGTIDGSAIQYIKTDYGAMELVTNGTLWFISNSQ